MAGSNSYGQSLDKQLLNACKSNKLALAIISLNAGADPNAVDENGASALMWAMYQSNLSVVKELVEKGAKLDTEGVIYLDSLGDSYYGSLTAIAAGEGSLEKLKYLIADLGIPYDEREFNPETEKKDGWTAIEWAYARNQSDAYQYLVSEGADLFEPKERRLKALEKDSGKNSFEYVRALRDVGKIHQSWNNFEEAEAYLKEAVSLLSLEHRSDSLEYEFAIRDLAFFYFNTKRCEDGFKPLSRSLSLIQEIYGGQSEYYTSSLIWLAKKMDDWVTECINSSEENQKEELYFKLLDFLEDHYGKSDTLFLKRKNELAILYYNQQAYGKAIPLLEEVLEKRKVAYGPTNEKLILSYKNLGVVYRDAGLYNSAYETLTESLDNYEKINGKDSTYSSIAYELAYVLVRQENHASAQELFQYVLSHTDSTSVLHRNCIHGLAESYLHSGEYQLAESYMNKSKILTATMEGENSESYITILTSLSQLQWRKGLLNQAEELTVQALELAKTSLGENHSSYATLLTNLGTLHSGLGQFKEAEKNLLKSSHIFKSVLGTEHPSYGTSLNSLALVYQNLGMPLKASEYFKEALDIARATYGKLHPDYALALINYANSLNYLGRIDTAKTCIDEALSVFEETKRTNHASYPVALQLSADLSRIHGDYEIAESQYEKALEFQLRLAGSDHPRYMIILDGLGQLYLRQGKLAEAEKLVTEMVEYRKKRFGTKSLDYSNAIENLSEFHEKIGNPQKALAVRIESVEIAKEILDTTNYEYAKRLGDLGLGYYKLDDYDKALEYQNQAKYILENSVGKNHPGYEIVLNNMVLAFDKLQEFEKAEQLHVELLKIKETLAESKPVEFANQYWEFADFYKAHAQFIKAQEYYQEGLRVKKLLWGDEHDEYASALNRVGVAYSEMGDMETSNSLYRQSLAVKQSGIGEFTSSYSVTLENLGVNFMRMGLFDESQKCVVKVLEIRREVFGEHHGIYGRTLGLLGKLASEVGNYNDAEKLLSQARSIIKLSEGVSNKDYSTVITNLAIVFNHLGNNEKALPLILESIAIDRSLYGENHPEYGRGLINAAFIMTELGHSKDEVETVLITGKNVIENAVGKRHSDYATAISNVGWFYTQWQQFDKADSYIRECAEIRARILGKNHPDYATALNNLANHLGRKKELADAEEMHKEALRIIKKTLGVNHPMYTSSVSNLCFLNRAIGDLAESDTLYSLFQSGVLNSLRIEFQHLSGEEKLKYIKEAGVRLTHIRSFLLDRYSARQSDVGKQLYQIEIEERGVIVRSNLSVRSSVEGVSDSLVNQLYNRWLFLNQSLASQNNLKQDDSKPYFAGIGIIARFRNDTFLITEIIKGGPAERIGIKSGDRIVSVDGELISSQNHDVDSLINMIRGIVGTKVVVGVESIANPDLRYLTLTRAVIQSSPIERIKSEIELIEKDLTRTSNDFAKNLKAGETDWLDIRNSLGEKDVAIEFSSFRFFRKDGEWSDSTFYVALVLRKDYEYPIMVKLCEEKQLDSLFRHGEESERDLIANLYRGAVSVGENNEVSYGKRLYELLWKPLDSLLNEGDKICFAPSGLMHRIALSAIPYDDEGTLLSDRYTLARLSTTAKLLDKEDEQSKPKEIALFGGVQYEWKETAKVDSVLEELSETFVSRALPTDLDRGNTTWTYLPGTLTETESIATLATNAGIKVKKYSSTEATEERMKSLGGKNSPTVLHIATHGFFFPDPERDRNENRMLQMMGEREQVYRYSDDPLNRAGLLFAGANSTWNGKETPTDREDGILTANEATYIPLNNTELVVLSACETGLGEIKGSEGVFGLQRAFKAAGAKYVMMSLWKVPDRETSEFMTEFYTSYLNGTSIPDSYHKAQKVMRNKYPHDPFKWAAFVLMK